MKNELKIDELNSICKIVSNYSDPELVKSYSSDWRNRYSKQALCVAFPKNENEISELLIFCNKNKISVIPQGGNTGLVGGTSPIDKNKAVIINLQKMNNILEINALNNYVVCEAGVILDSIINECENASLSFPIKMSSSGSCQVGGIIATNAGGINVIKYGSIRSNILGLDVILANGEKLKIGSKVIKDNTGYNLKDLFCGSEGTLAVITKATIRVFPKFYDYIDCFVSFNSIKELIIFSKKIMNDYRERIDSLEIITNSSFDMCRKHNLLKRNFFSKDKEYYILMRLSYFEEVNFFLNNLSSKFKTIVKDDNEFLIAQDSQQSIDFWNFRHNLSEVQSKEGKMISFDISIPIDCLEIFINDAKLKISSILDNIKFSVFGHLGDGNIHFNLIEPNNYNENFYSLETNFKEIIYNLLIKYEGSISAEHGIGQLKKDDLSMVKSELEINMMKKIKDIFDPNQILNPGKIF